MSACPVGVYLGEYVIEIIMSQMATEGGGGKIYMVPFNVECINS